MEGGCTRRDRRGPGGAPALAAAALAAVLCLAAGHPAIAQGAGGELAAYLDRTDELLDWASGLVRDTGSEQARRVLAQARELQQRGRDLAARQRLLDAFAVGRRARDAMWHAVRLAREATSLEERIRLRSERFDDQYAQLADRAGDGGSSRANDLLGQARETARRARERTRQGDFQMAWKLLEQADDLLRMAARLLAESAGPERVDQELERARQMLADAGDRLAGPGTSAPTLGLLEDARDALARAHEAASAGDSGRALTLAGLARRLAQRALDATGDRADADAVERLLARFDDRAGNLAERVRGADDRGIRRVFERAGEQRAAAAKSLADGRTTAAQRQVRSALDLLDQVEQGLR